ncbi:MAG: PKD domain-containing protein, partial [Bacteroidales bacterium]|nr:PKD domain-containing protein [Bacteroidales bacterium]
VPPAAVLLLGDYGTSGNTIISPTWNSYCVSDNIYADVDNDDLPDIIFARMTAQNATHLETMITKFLDYERTPPTNPDFYDNPITAMGYQSDRWFQLCSEIINGFWEYGLGKNPVRENAGYTNGSAPPSWSTNTNTSIILDYFGPSGLGYVPATPSHLTDWGGNATRLNIDINSGAFMLQHRDHGGTTGWSHPSYSNSDIDNLYNTDLVWVFSINCLTGKYNISSECFAEKFHRYTHNGQNSGALGVTAASEVSYSFVNDTYVWGMYDNMWPDFMPNEVTDPPSRGILPAFGNAAGKIFLQQSSWPYNPQHKVYTHHLFHHHGDAFSTVYSEIPQYLTVVHDPVLIAGATTFSVTANAGSLIALTVNGEIIGIADGTGSAVAITIPAQGPGNVMVVTVTKQNYYRYSTNVDIVVDGIYADFSADITNPCTGGSVTFTDLSFGTITSWNWSFPGGTPNSYNGQNPPLITYNTAGTYDVSLAISNGTDNDTETKTGYITIENIIADFTGTPTSVIAGNTVTFTDNSICIPTTWNWTFPGGTPGTATGPGPHTITYNTGGTYDVTLFISNASNNDTETKTDYIDVIDCYAVTLPWLEDFEDVGPTITFTANEPNINGSCKWSYEKTANGRLQFDVYNHNGLQGAAVDCTPSGTMSINHLTATLNLINYASSTNLELSFWHRNYSEENHANDRVWIRGSNSDTWIEIYDLYDDDANSNWVEVTGLDIDAEISAHGQSITSTFQLRFGQEDNYSFASDGRVFDDISITGAAPGLWTGTTSTDWGTTTNWDDGNIPVAGTDVTIPTSSTGGNFPETNTGGGAVCNNLTIQSGAHLCVPSNNTLTVNGTLINDAGVSGLIIKSTSSDGTGSLITYNGAEGTVQNYYTDGRWHFISSPVSNAVSNIFLNIYLKTWHENTYTWEYISVLDFDLVPGTGYEIWSTVGNPTINYSGGVLNTGDISPTITATDVNGGGIGDNEGWNFAGNPYQSAIDLGNSGNPLPDYTWTNLDSTVYFWNGVQYAEYNPKTDASVNGGTRYVPSMQGFFVKANASNPVLTIPNSARLHSTQANYKSSGDNPLVRLTVEGNGYSDETLILVYPGSTQEFDPGYDAYKLWGIEEAPQLYSIVTENILSINTLPEIVEETIMELGLKVGNEAQYTITLTEVVQFENFDFIILEDLETGTFINLLEDPAYSFTAIPGNEPNRFLLHFGEPSSIDENNQFSVRIYSNENIVYIQNPENIDGDIIIYDMLGQEIIREKIENEELIRIKLTQGTGYYLVKVQSDKQLVTEKVFIR